MVPEEISGRCFFLFFSLTKQTQALSCSFSAGVRSVTGGLAVVVDSEGPTWGVVYPGNRDPDGVADGSVRSRGSVRSHRRPGRVVPWLRAASAFVKASSVNTFEAVIRSDLALAGTSFLVATGMVLSILGMLAWLVADSNVLARGLGVAGVACWLFALGVCAIFLSGPQPRHGKRR